MNKRGRKECIGISSFDKWGVKTIKFSSPHMPCCSFFFSYVSFQTTFYAIRCIAASKWAASKWARVQAWSVIVNKPNSNQHANQKYCFENRQLVLVIALEINCWIWLVIILAILSYFFSLHKECQERGSLTLITSY